MKKVLYTAPAIVICVIYGMLALLAGGFASFQARAWLMILLPVISAALLVRGKWWGCCPGMILGGLLISIGGNGIAMAFGGIVFLYYAVMGILCGKDARNK